MYEPSKRRSNEPTNDTTHLVCKKRYRIRNTEEEKCAFQQDYRNDLKRNDYTCYINYNVYKYSYATNAPYVRLPFHRLHSDESHVLNQMLCSMYAACSG